METFANKGFPFTIVSLTALHLNGEHRVSPNKLFNCCQVHAFLGYKMVTHGLLGDTRISLQWLIIVPWAPSYWALINQPRVYPVSPPKPGVNLYVFQVVLYIRLPDKPGQAVASKIGQISLSIIHKHTYLLFITRATKINPISTLFFHTTIKNGFTYKYAVYASRHWSCLPISII